VTRFFLLLITALLADGQSHPGWWTFVAPDSKSLVGIEWSKLAGSPFSSVLRAELSSDGSLGFPDLPCLLASRDFLISSPPFLAAANGGCTAALLREQATAKAMKPTLYHGFTIWVPAANSGLGAAQFGDQVALIGSRKSIEAAIDRSPDKNLDKNLDRSPDPAVRRYSPLLIAGARLARTRDLWVVSTELPDPLASLFVPLGITARNFEGGMTARDGTDRDPDHGLEISAILDAASEKAAGEVAASIRSSIPTLPAVAKGLEVASNGSSVTLALKVSRAELLASLRQPETKDAFQALESAAPAANPTLAPIPMPAPNPARAIAVWSSPGAAPAPQPTSQPTPPPAPGPEKPYIIRIYGLDDGVREIVVPPKQP
jgi:hypothetical protein